MQRTSQTPLVTDVKAGEALSVSRFFTKPGVDPFSTVEWELRDARIAHGDRVAFEQRGVEFPKTWSQNATNIVAQKYFRGQLDSPTREHSVRQMVGRVAGTIADWGRSRGYFASVEDGDTFQDELTYVLLHQMAAFNSPVWFNVGFEESPQCSACMPYGALISTPDGMVPIGELVERDLVGREVYDADGVTRIVATKSNGVKPVFRVRLRNGSFVEATADHVVKAVRERRTAAAVAAGRRARARDADAPASASGEGGRACARHGRRPARRRRCSGGGRSACGLRGRARRLAAGRRVRRPVRPRDQPLADDRVPGRQRRGARLGRTAPRCRVPGRPPQGPRRRHAARPRSSASVSTARCFAISSSATSCSLAAPRSACRPRCGRRPTT